MNLIDAINQEVYTDPKICNSYTHLTSLFIAESTILNKIKNEITEQDRILDIGIGTGRTTPFLLELSPRYIGIDYSKQMITIARTKFPNLNLMECDVRDLSQFKDAGFSLVFFSFNGLYLA